MPSRLSRRRFVQGVAAATVAAPTILTSLPKARAAANERLTLGVIGVGTMGRGHHLKRFLDYGDVQIVAVCDVVAERRDHSQAMVDQRYADDAKAGTYQGCQAFNDFRELLALDGLDAVLIATPDHWHVPGAILAARAGKDIYCEKPLTLTIGEGRHLVDEVRANNIIFQTGSQQRSEFGGHFRKAVELVRNGRIGKVKTIRIGVGGPPVPCDLPEEDVPEGTDWDMWLGQAPWRGYNEILCPKGVHKHFPAFRNYREYAGGALADMGAHHFDIAQWALDMDGSGPVKVEPPSGEATSGLKFTYANGVEMFHGGPTDCTFEGELGTINVSRGHLESSPAEIAKTPLKEGDWHAPPSDNHGRNWLEAIKTRKLPICDVEVGHRSATVCHLANLGYQLRRPLVWDPQKERFENDDEANVLLNREPRDPWKI
ncbi:MAG: gfo/Idh/MocA family oxidoreductase [Planctomycetota bacterium]|nr:MAG: gfo/Idh/MocA family oxidoreductase [Planctomycetota bacterium]